ncbi:hypothetical protein BGZ83_006652 [Gryganskiella cystojenkinii]|nr:hypothetical protein BGZ83_006652 [Gryganskiella cystojenkinii]
MAKPKKSKLLPPRSNSAAQAGFEYTRSGILKEAKDIAFDKSLRQEEEEMLALTRLLRTVKDDHERTVKVTKRILSLKQEKEVINNGEGSRASTNGGPNMNGNANRYGSAATTTTALVIAQLASELDLDLDEITSSILIPSKSSKGQQHQQQQQQYPDLPDLLPPPPPSFNATDYRDLPPISQLPLLATSSTRVIQNNNRARPKKKTTLTPPTGGSKFVGGGSSDGSAPSSRRGSSAMERQGNNQNVVNPASRGTAQKRRASPTSSTRDQGHEGERGTRIGTRVAGKRTTTRSGREVVPRIPPPKIKTETRDDDIMMDSAILDSNRTRTRTRSVTPKVTATLSSKKISPTKRPATPSMSPREPHSKRLREQRGSTVDTASSQSTPGLDIEHPMEGGAANDDDDDPDFEPDSCLQCIRSRIRCQISQRSKKSACGRCVRHGIHCDPVVVSVAFALDPTLPPIPLLNTPGFQETMTAAASISEAASSSSSTSSSSLLHNPTLTLIPPTRPIPAKKAKPRTKGKSSSSKGTTTKGLLGPNHRTRCHGCKQARVKCEYLNRADDGSKDLCHRCDKFHLKCVPIIRTHGPPTHPAGANDPVKKEELLATVPLSNSTSPDRPLPAIVSTAGLLLSGHTSAGISAAAGVQSSGQDHPIQPYQMGQKRQLAFPDGISKANILEHRPRRAAAAVGATGGRQFKDYSVELPIKGTTPSSPKSPSTQAGAALAGASRLRSRNSSSSSIVSGDITTTVQVKAEPDLEVSISSLAVSMMARYLEEHESGPTEDAN